MRFHPDRHLLRLVAGWLMIVLGLLGLVLPILQGLLFLAIGIYLLTPFVPALARLQVWLHRRFPWIPIRLAHWRARWHQRWRRRR
ncbi:MAG: hypothetical protein K9N49_10130 [Candidatus Marinimicrobia bacterium]|nr:hypothetical protein [Candidatus Neomarinimicrobiota bacterium]